MRSNRLREPGVIKLLHLTGLDHAGNRGVNQGLELRILAEHRGVGLFRDGLVQERVCSRGLGVRDLAGKQNIVHHVSNDAVLGEQLEGFGVILRGNHTGIDAFLAEILQQRDRGRAGGGRNVLVIQILEGLDAGILLHGSSNAHSKVRGAEVDELLALLRIRGGAALNVIGAVQEQRNAVAGGNRLPLDRQLAADLLFNSGGDVLADFVAVADRLALGVEVGERNGRVAVADREDAGILRLLQGAVERRGSEGGAGD